MAPTAAQLMVKNDWAVVKKDMMGHGARFWQDLFVAQPSYTQKFDFLDTTNATDLARLTPDQLPEGLKKQVMNMMNELDRIIDLLGGDQGKLVDELKRFGHSHTRYGLTRQHFKTMNMVMMNYYSKVLKLDREHTENWRLTLAWVFDIVSEGMHELRDEQLGAQAIVKNDWADIQVDMMRHGSHFWQDLFVARPDLVKKFSMLQNTSAAQLASLTPEQLPEQLKKQIMNMMKEMTRIVSLIDGDQEALLSELKRFGRSHTRYGLTRADFESMNQVMLAYFSKTLMFDKQHQEAWSKTLTWVFDTISDAM